MSPAKTLYVRDSDAKTWQRAEQRAERKGTSLSNVIAQLLGGWTAPQPERVRVAVPGSKITTLVVMDRDLADDQDFDRGALTVDEQTSNLEWNRDGWRLWFLDTSGEVDEHMLCHHSWTAPEAISSAVQQLTERAKPETANDEIVVDMRNEDGRTWQEGFRGRWIIEPSDENRFGEDAGACYGIALTAKGKIATYAYHVNDRWRPSLDVWDDLDAMQDGLNLADEAIAMVSSELGEQRVVWRDI